MHRIKNKLPYASYIPLPTGWPTGMAEGIEQAYIYIIGAYLYLDVAIFVTQPLIAMKL